MALEEILCSRPRIKILKLIYTLGQLNVSDIARRLNTNYTSISGHIQILESEGILELRTYGRVRMYRFSSSAKAQAVAGLIEAWEKQTA
ncbi:winged helix-turn-helix domain-containing protein [Candidatus Bathycorpusculum sp.]|uniref:winged helix-turn-helix domain-containing protein n=1 Tax=Candidatus Bathycorpusculum sp. TaxID=2994959 RepID=UPI0028172CCC|nr:winged helix-turn-helix domain-containing protein [Candidatus Termitimicrobium sp.]MCL2685498.1 winged helix-turn-helix domain-containing protein [Candidatus Termitimicrobium sp.]